MKAEIWWAPNSLFKKNRASKCFPCRAFREENFSCVSNSNWLEFLSLWPSLSSVLENASHVTFAHSLSCPSGTPVTYTLGPYSLAPHCLASLQLIFYYSTSELHAGYFFLSCLSFKIFIYYVFISQNSIMFCLKLALPLFTAFYSLQIFPSLVFYFFTRNKLNCFKFTPDESSASGARGCVSAASALVLARRPVPCTQVSCDRVLPAALPQWSVQNLWGQRWGDFPWGGSVLAPADIWENYHPEHYTKSMVWSFLTVSLV